MEKRGILHSDVFRAFLMFEESRYSYDGARLTNYKDVAVVFKMDDGLYEVVTVYTVDPIYEECYLGPIKGVDLKNIQSREDLYNAFRTLVEGETNPYRVGKAALNSVKLLIAGKMAGHSLHEDRQQTIRTFKLMWDYVEIALKNNHRGALAFLRQIWAVLKNQHWQYPEFEQDYSERYNELCQIYKTPKSAAAIDLFQDIEEAFEQNPLSIWDLVYVLIVRMRDHSYHNHLEFHINANILAVLRYNAHPIALFTLYIVGHYARLQKFKDLQEDLQPFLLIEEDRALFAKEDPDGKVSMEWISYYEEVGKNDRYINNKSGNDSLLRIASMHAGLQLGIDYVNSNIFLEYFNLYGELYGQKIFSKFLKNAPVELGEAIEPFRHLTLASALEMFFLRSLKRSLRFAPEKLNPNAPHFTYEMDSFVHIYSWSMHKLLSAYIEIVQMFNKVEAIFNGNYIGKETLEERQALLRDCARELFMLGFSAVIENADNGEAAAWFNSTVSPQIENAGFLALGIQGPQGVHLMRKLLALSKSKDTPVLFKVYITLLLGQYSLHITENVANAITYLEYLKARPILYLRMMLALPLKFAFERLAEQCGVAFE